MRITGHARSCILLFVSFFVTGYAFLSPSWGQTPSTPAQIQSFQLVAPKTGWLVAGNRLFFTTTLGSQWSEITPNTTATLSGVYFRPDGNGWVLESSVTPADATTLTLAHTADNGAHWTTTAIASPFTSASAFNGSASTYFPDAQHGFLMLGVQSSSAFRLGIFLRTTDGGATWQQAPTPPAGGNITFLDATHGFDGPGPAGDELYTTADAGNTWQRITLASPAALATTHSTIALPVFTGATNGTLLRTYAATGGGPTIATYTTTDGGATWSIASTTQSSTPAIVALAHDGSSTGRITATAAVAGLPSVAPSTVLTPVRSSFATAANGWVEFRSGSCTNGTCTQTDSLLATLDGGKTYFSPAQITGIQLQRSTTFTIPTKPTSSLTHGNFNPASSTVYDTAGIMGFDACSLPTIAQLTDWIANSPYRVVGVYLGGENLSHCTSTASLNSTWVSTVLGMGWQIIPIWVGPQGGGACSGNCATMSSTPATAMSQGESEADSIIAIANADGIGQGSTMMYDMEAYTRGGANTTATQSFLEGWTTELHNKGYLAATYSSHPEFTDWYPNVVNPDVDIIWFAYFFNTGVACGTECQTVFPTESSFDISSSYWLNNHRARQTSSGFNSTYGTTTINIDEDWVDAAMVTATPNLLTVATVGSGSVASTTIANPNGDSTAYTAISCGSTCTANFAPTDTLTLVATPASNYTFSSWAGCTSTSGSTCTVSVATAKTVTATFVSGYALSVTKSGTGAGTVTSADSTINCGTTCSANYTSPTTETLTETPAAGTTFTGWTGCTTAVGATCTVAINGATSVTAAFTGPVALTVTKSGTGAGTVTSSDSLINCGSTCSASYTIGSMVTLTAAPSSGSIFTSWSGCTSTNGTSCSVTMAAADSVTATFTATAFTAALSAPSLTITAGQSGTSTITFTPTGNYTGTFSSFSCTGLSSTVGTCSFTPTSLTATGNNAALTTTLTISTSAVTAQLATHNTSRLAFAGLLLPAFLLPLALRRKYRNTPLRKPLLLAFAVATLGLTPLLTGCGGSSTPATNNTPVFSGTVQINYTASTNTTASQIPLQLTVNR
jgi:hypothetical protein